MEGQPLTWANTITWITNATSNGRKTACKRDVGWVFQERTARPSLQSWSAWHGKKRIRHTPIEFAETRALLADIERQIKTQEQLDRCLPRQRTADASRHADCKRDHIQEMRREYDA